MKGGQPRGRASGFTIVEVMIVLVVTMAIFASAIVFIGGRESIATFNEESGNLESQLQSVVNEVSSGFYNFDATNRAFKCAVTGTSLSLSTPAPPGNDNQGCNYLGKAIQFTTGDTFYVYDVLGLREDANGKIPATYQAALPTTDYQIDNLVAQESLGHELKVACMKYSLSAGTPLGCTGGGGRPIGTVAILNDPSPTTSPATPSGPSGTVQVNVVPVQNTSLTNSQNGVAGEPNGTINSRNATGFARTADGNKNPAGGVGICFASQSTQQSILITIGGVSRKATIESKVYDGANCT